MSDLEDAMTAANPNRAAIKLEVDAWERRRLRIKKYYISNGLSDEEADEKATTDVCREIRRTAR